MNKDDKATIESNNKISLEDQLKFLKAIKEIFEILKEI